MRHWFVAIWILLGILPLHGQTIEQDLQVTASPVGGFYATTTLVELSYPKGTTLYYTLDGTSPSPKHGYVYAKPIPIAKTSVLRCRAYEGKHAGPIRSFTYFIKEPTSTLPVLSISLPDVYLFGREKGLFVHGNSVRDTVWNKPKANFWSKREVPVSMEYFDPQKGCVLRQQAGFRLFGGMSRLFPQKSFALVARDAYGENRFKYPVFGESQPKKFKYLVFRNGGSDYNGAHFRDAFMTGLVQHWDMETQAAQAAIVYINGTYWGIYNVREKVNKFFLDDHADVDKGQIDLIEHQKTVKQGSIRKYEQLLAFLRTHSLAETAHFKALEKMMEVDNFMDYQLAQIYFDNRDAGGNIKFWRPRTPEGRWRWILYDTDWGFGMHQDKAYMYNSLAFHTAANGPNWPNPPWSTFILRKLLANEDFKRAFVNRCLDHLNTDFRSERVMQEMARWEGIYEPEVGRHLKRWNQSYRHWKKEVAVMRTFAQQRPIYLRNHFRAAYNGGADAMLTLSASYGGHLLLNKHVEVKQDTFQGVYFQNIPIELQAIPRSGYRFSHWEGLGEKVFSRHLHLRVPAAGMHIRAVYTPFRHPLEGEVVINEISGTRQSAGDWIEIYNRSNKTVHLNHWLLSDAHHEIALPAAEIGAGEYLVLCKDVKAFQAKHKTAYHCVQALDFGINKRKETLMLVSADGALIDSVGYNLPPQDTFFTYSLLLPHLDNADADHWELRPGDGTPNQANPYYIQSIIQNRWANWLQIGLALVVLLMGGVLLYLKKQGVFDAF